MKLVPIGATHDGASFGFVDLVSIHSSGSTRSYWVLWVNTAKEAALPRHIYYAMRHYTDDCVAHSSHYTYLIFYDHGGEALDRADPGAPVTPVIPGSIGSDIEMLVCEGKAPITDTNFRSVDAAMTWVREQPN